ncbi:unnamed protein product [Mucor hiemalis]
MTNLVKSYTCSFQVLVITYSLNIIGKDLVSKRTEKNTSSTKLTKRALKIESKLKTKSAFSLFDSDGDLSRHNIIEGGRRTRKRTTSSEDSSTTTKPKRVKSIKNAKQKLLPAPKTPLDTIRNDNIENRLKRMEEIKNCHNASVKELYLELFQNMLDYNPKTFINDIRYNKYMSDYDVWETLKSNNTVDDGFVDLLSSVVYESHIPNKNDKVSSIHSGTGVRRQVRQFSTLKDYLNSFVTMDDTEDITPEERDALIAKERTVRQRLHALEERGGFQLNYK